MIFGKHINKYYLKYILFFLFGVLALITVDIVQLEMPEIIGNIIDGLEAKTLTNEILKDYMLKMFVIAAVMFVGRFLWRFCLFGAGIRIENDLRREMFKKTEVMSIEYLSENKTGALMALYTNDLETIRRTLANGMLMLIDALGLGTISFIKMWKLNPMLTLVSAIPLFLLVIFGGLISKLLKEKSKINHEAFASLLDFSQESFSGIAVVKAFVKETIEAKEFAKYNRHNADSNIKLVKVSVLFDIVLSAVISSIFIIILGLGGYVVYEYVSGMSDKVFTIGDLTKFSAYFDSLIWPMMALGQLINFTSQGKASLGRISELLDHEVEINDDKAIPLEKPLEGKITFKDFSFKYPSNDREILHNINLTINKGEMIGVIGRTGCGKTTLVSSLLRLYNIENDKVFIDDVDIMTIPLKDVRECISFVPQDNFLFSSTILDNIAFSKDEKDMNEEMEVDVKEFASMSDVDEDISLFKEGYKTILGERGLTVSGGQRQRISIARALIKDAPILVLDDSVSAVDTKTEEIILENLRKIRKDKTTIIIAHRITTLETLDKIIVIEDGSVTGFANHNELLETNAFYKKQVKLQELEKEVGM